MKIGLIGTGYWGPNIVRNLLALKQDVTIYDSNKKNLDRTLKQYNTCRCAGSLEEITYDPEIKGVAIAVPLVNHSGLVIKSLQAGKHVFVEKSLCHSPAEADEIKKCLGNKILMVGHITLFTGSTAKMRESIERGDIGKLTGIFSTRTHLGRVYPGIDVATEVSSHDIAVFLYLLKEMPLSVNAWGSSRLGRTEPDNARIMLRFKGDLECFINVQWSSIIRERKIIIEGTSGSIVCTRNNEKEELTWYDQRESFRALKAGIYPAEAMKLVNNELLFSSSSEPLYDELDHFLQCIENNKQPLTDYCFGRKVVNILESIRMSMNQKGKTVNIQ